MTRIPPIFVVLVIGAIAAFSVLRVEFSTSLYRMLPQDLPEVQGMDRLSRFFSRDGQLIVTVRADDAAAADEAVESLSEHLSQEPALVADVYREFSLPDLVTEGAPLLAWLWLNAAPEKLAAVSDRLDADSASETIAASMESIVSGFADETTMIASYDPLGFARLGEVLGEAATNPDPMASEDRTFQVIYVEGAGVDFSSYREAASWLAKVRAASEKWKLDQRADVQIGLTGTPAFMAEVGSEMEKDMTISVTATMLLIALLFWFMHRQSRPLAWLVSAMLATLAITLNASGLIFGNLSVMSAGFAAIVMGLAVDYGIILYRHAMGRDLTAKELRQAMGPSILWAATTTAVVFLSLNFSSLPGLAEMGNLVAIGVLTGAVVMLYVFAPVAVSFVSRRDQPRGIPSLSWSPSRAQAGWLAAAIPALALGSIFIKEVPGLEPNFHPFRIRQSPSMVAWQALQSELRGRENTAPAIVTGATLPELIDHLDSLETRVEAARENSLIDRVVLPDGLIPNPRHQAENAVTLRALLSERERLLDQIEGGGFTEEGTTLTAKVFDAWSGHLDQLQTAPVALPSGRLAEWTIGRLYAESDGSFAALASIRPVDSTSRAWVEAISDPDTAVASLSSLGTALNERIKIDLARILIPMLGLLTLMLAVVFRNWRDLALSVFALAFAGSAMLILTVWTPLSWNSFNLCGVPIIFGTGLDFSIHMILALRRHHGDAQQAREGIGKALVFCGLSTAIGFGSLATASAHGLASLGVVCATGILINLAVAVWLIPMWYRWLHAKRS
ncbi:MAG: putative RND superfamily exporter protein [Verrucomicrobiales bacterium]|jgi:predicted RND superfamily exporter protein